MALPGHLGIEFDLRQLDANARSALRGWIDLYKQLRERLHQGRVWRGSLPDGMGAIVEVVGGVDTTKDTLMALIWNTNAPADSPLRLVDELSSDQQALISQVDNAIASALPAYMMPSTYLVFAGRPEQTPSGKVNRRHLSGLAKEVPAHTRAKFAPGAMEAE